MILKMPTICFSIGGEEHDITNKSSNEVMTMIKAEYVKKKKKKIKFKVKNIDWVWCCGNKIPKEDEAVGCSYCF